MKDMIIIACVFLFCSGVASPQIFVQPQEKVEADSSIGVIDVKPSELYIEEPDTTNFIETTVKVLNRGDAPLRIKNVKGSCYCSQAVIKKQVVYPLDVGELIFQINLDGLSKNDSSVLYTIKSDAKNSPYFVKVHIVKKENSEGE